MPELKDQILAIVKKNINVPGVINDSIDGIGEPLLRAAVAKSETKIDDILLAALYQPLEDEIKARLKALWEGLLVASPAGGGELVSGSGEPV